MRAVVVDAGRARLAEIPEPGNGALRVRACGLGGSDVEKPPTASAGTVLGHEVVAEAADGRRIALVHHVPCGKCERCAAGHESTCDRFRAATIEPGGFAEHVVARGFVGQLFAAVLRERGDHVAILDPDPARGDAVVPDEVDAAVLCAPAGANAATGRVRPGGTILVFADAGELPLDHVYRKELDVAGSRSATP